MKYGKIFDTLKASVVVEGGEFKRYQFNFIKGDVAAAFAFGKTTELSIITPKVGKSKDVAKVIMLKGGDFLEGTTKVPIVLGESVDGSGAILAVVAWESVQVCAVDAFFFCFNTCYRCLFCVQGTSRYRHEGTIFRRR